MLYIAHWDNVQAQVWPARGRTLRVLIHWSIWGEIFEFHLWRKTDIDINPSTFKFEAIDLCYSKARGPHLQKNTAAKQSKAKQFVT